MIALYLEMELTFQYMNNKTNKTMQFKDYPAEEIAAKLKEVEEFEAKYGEKPMTKSWRKWCTDYEYRKNEWEFRQGIHKNYKQITNAIG